MVGLPMGVLMEAVTDGVEGGLTPLPVSRLKHETCTHIIPETNSRVSQNHIVLNNHEIYVRTHMIMYWVPRVVASWLKASPGKISLRYVKRNK